MAESNVKRVANGKYPPQKTSYLWLDTSNPTIPILKEFSDGSWITYSGGGGGGGGDTQAIIDAIRGSDRNATTTAIYAKLGDMTVLIENVDDLIETLIDSQTGTLESWITDKTTEVKNYVNTRAEVTDEKIDDLAPIVLANGAVAALANELKEGKDEIVRSIRHKGGSADFDDTLLELSESIEDIPQSLISDIIIDMSGNEIEDAINSEFVYELAIAASFKNRFTGYGGYYVLYFHLAAITTSTMTQILSGAEAYYTSDGYFYDANDYANGNVLHTWHLENINDGGIFVVYLFGNENYETTVSSLANVKNMFIGGKPAVITISSTPSVVNNLVMMERSPVININTSGRAIMNTYLQGDSLTINIGGNDNCRSIAIKGDTVSGSIGSIQNCSNVKFIGFSTLGNVTIGDSSRLSYLDLSGVTYSLVRLSGTSNLGMISLSLPDMEQMRALFQRGAPYSFISKIDAPNLETLLLANDNDNLIKSSVLKSINLPKLRNCSFYATPSGDYIGPYIFQSPTIEVITLPLWEGPPTTIRRCYYNTVCINCTSLRELHLPKFKSAEWGTLIDNCPNIEVIDVPECSNVGTFSYVGYKLRNLLKLHTFIVGPNATLADTFNGDINLIHLEIADTKNSNLSLKGWEPTNAMDSTVSDLVESGESFNNNLEKFLYNFQTYIVDMLADRTGTSALTLTLNTAVYNVLTQTILDSIAAKNWTISQV